MHPEIPWRPIQAQRQVLAHDYGEIKHDRSWRVAEMHVPDLIGLLEPLVPDLPAEKEEKPAFIQFQAASRGAAVVVRQPPSQPLTTLDLGNRNHVRPRPAFLHFC